MKNPQVLPITTTVLIWLLRCSTGVAAHTPDAFYLEDGSWRVTDAASVPGPPEAVAGAGIDTSKWTPALVPGTVLASYLAAGKVPDPNFGNQQTQIPDADFTRDFWYRDEFTAPASYAGRRVFLNFDGINWKADVYLNGASVGRIEGAFMRGKFDVTKLIHTGQRNTVAVLIHTVAHPGPVKYRTLEGEKPYNHNGGILDLDGPTFEASQGWNWVPTIRGRDIGIWNHVYLAATDAVQIVDPYVTTDVSPDLGQAGITLKVDLKNSSAEPVEGELVGKMGDVTFRRGVRLSGTESQTVTLDGTSTPELKVAHPRLWWPNGYGDHPLYTMDLTFVIKDKVSDEQVVRFGIRKFTYDTTHGLRISVNGRWILCDGGNWGMDESMLRYGKADYETAVKYHKDMHLVMIRDWVGQTAKDEFYDTCDENGILVWNDFWQANPADGPEPTDKAMYIANLRDWIPRIRNHACIAVWCGRNEAKPTGEIAAALEAALVPGTSGTDQLLDTTRIYVPNSKGGVVTGGGPYEPESPEWYFGHRGTTFHTELGLVCVPPVDAMRLTMPEKDLWPMSDDWAVHDYYQKRTRVYTKMIGDRYGTPVSLEDFCEKAQLLNLETSKAMLECWRANRGGGGLIWMTHPAWPSLICQLYDYFLSPTAAYFGVKTAAEPVHIFWNALTNAVEVANDSPNDLEGAKAKAVIYDMDGVAKSTNEVAVSATAGSVNTAMTLNFPAEGSPVKFVELTLTKDGAVVSRNFYWRGDGKSNVGYTTLAQMPQVNLTKETKREDKDGTTTLTTTVTNPTANVALMVELRTAGSHDPRKRIAPILYEDNYFSLAPHESRVIHTSFATRLLGAGEPVVRAKAWNSAAF